MSQDQSGSSESPAEEMTPNNEQNASTDYNPSVYVDESLNDQDDGGAAIGTGEEQEVRN
jgi:hypothetical protein